MKTTAALNTAAKIPDCINVDKMTAEEFIEIIRKGIEDVENGNITDAKQAFEEFRRIHK